MVDALSQKDIDSLLEGGGQALDVQDTRDEVIQFDFRHPPRIARDKRANLETIFARYATSIQGFLSSRLRVPADVVLSSVEQATFAEFIFSLASPCAAVLFDLGADSAYEGVVDLGTDLSFFLIDRLFGGPGDGQVKRPMTYLERTVIKGVADRVLAFFGEAWKDDIPFQPVYTGFESTPDALAITGRDENVLVANMEVRAGRFNGLITTCLPLHALESFLQDKPQKGARPHIVPEHERLEMRGLIEGSLRQAKLDVVARFPLFCLSAADAAALEPGTVIHTGHHLEIPIEVLVSGRRRFSGSLGQIHRDIGVRVSEVHQQRGDQADPRMPRGKVL